jgi:hypothetical protein
LSLKRRSLGSDQLPRLRCFPDSRKRLSRKAEPTSSLVMRSDGGWQRELAGPPIEFCSFTQHVHDLSAKSKRRNIRSFFRESRKIWHATRARRWGNAHLGALHRR